jgi:hypothetical protein
MNKNDNSSLWTIANRSRYFLIPNNQELPNGKFNVYENTGEKGTPSNFCGAMGLSYELPQESRPTLNTNFCHQLIIQTGLSLPNFRSSYLQVYLQCGQKLRPVL